MEEEIAAIEPSVEEVDVDSDGTLFDPTLHVRTKTKGGKWRRKRGVEEQNETTEDVANLAVAANATITTIAFETICVSVFGNVWRMHENEKKMIAESVKEVYIYYNLFADVNPLFGLACVVSSYIAPRLQEETTKSTLDRITTWVKGKFN